MTLAAFCLAYAGFSALCLGMDRHYEDVFDRELPRRHRLPLRLFGWIALALSLVGLGGGLGLELRHGRMDRHPQHRRPAADLVPDLPSARGLTAGGLCALAAPVLAVV